MNRLILALALALCSCGTIASDKYCYNTADCDYLEWHGGASPSLIMKGVHPSTSTRAAGSVAGTVLAGMATLAATHGAAAVVK